MQDTAHTLVSALFSGNIANLVQILLMFVMAHYGGYVIGWLSGKAVLGIAYVAAKLNETQLGRLTQIDDRFFGLLRQSVGNQVNLKTAMAAALADGSLDAEDAKTLAAAAYADFKANLGVKDWADLGLLLLGSPRASRDDVERKLEARFNANVHNALSETAANVISRRLQTRQLVLQNQEMAVRALSAASAANNGTGLPLLQVRGLAGDPFVSASCASSPVKS